MIYFLVKPQQNYEIEEIEREPEEWEEQYYDIFKDKLEAYMFAHNQLHEKYLKDSEDWKQYSHNWKIDYLKMLYKYELEHLKKLPPWFSYDVLEATNGKIKLGT